MVERRVPNWRYLQSLLSSGARPGDVVGSRVAKAADVLALRRIARRRVPRAVFDYVDGGADGEYSLRASRESFTKWEFVPRILRDVGEVDTSTRILGQNSSIPLVLAPTGYTRMMHHEGEIAVGRSAQSADVPYALSTMGTTSIEGLAQSVPGARKWFQLYLWRDRTACEDMVERAQTAGYDSIVLTVDVPVGGNRLRDVFNGLTIPPSLTFRTIADAALHPRWWFNLLTTEPLEFASLTGWSGTAAELGNKIFDPTATFEDLAWLREIWRGSIVVKGLLSCEDARKVADAGVDAIVVSNHGGRQLDRTVSPLDQLPSISSAVGHRLEVLVDGGVLRGSDIVTALALGARAVLIGRAYLYGLMAGGEPGVDRTIGILTEEMARTMQLLGVTNVSDISPEVLKSSIRERVRLAQVSS